MGKRLQMDLNSISEINVGDLLLRKQYGFIGYVIKFDPKYRNVIIKWSHSSETVSMSVNIVKRCIRNKAFQLYQVDVRTTHTEQQK